MRRQGSESGKATGARGLIVSAAAGLLVCAAPAPALGQQTGPSDPPPPEPPVVAGAAAGALPPGPPSLPQQETPERQGRRRLLHRGATEPGRTGPLARLRERLKGLIPH
jgi:hypothetical protein